MGRGGDENRIVLSLRLEEAVESDDIEQEPYDEDEYSEVELGGRMSMQMTDGEVKADRGKELSLNMGVTGEVGVELELSLESLLEEQPPLRRYTLFEGFAPGFTAGERRLSTVRGVRTKTEKEGKDGYIFSRHMYRGVVEDGYQPAWQCGVYRSSP
jgi:hypothetical protein